MKVFIASDHGGYKLKEVLKLFLATEGHEVEDMGARHLDPEDDYPDIVIPLAEKVTEDEGSLGIVIGRSGNGEQIAANKVQGARAALCLTPEMAKKARQDNHANILSLGADFIEVYEAERVVKTFLETPYSKEERHKRRVEKIKEYESAHFRQD